MRITKPGEIGNLSTRPLKQKILKTKRKPAHLDSEKTQMVFLQRDIQDTQKQVYYKQEQASKKNIKNIKLPAILKNFYDHLL